jgi:nitrate/nitrite transporter NarK
LRLEGTLLGDAANVPYRMAAAGAIAWINSIGNLGGFSGSGYVGWMRDLTGSYDGGLYGLAVLGLVAAFVSAFFLHIPDPAGSIRGSGR